MDQRSGRVVSSIRVDADAVAGTERSEWTFLRMRSVSACAGLVADPIETLGPPPHPRNKGGCARHAASTQPSTMPPCAERNTLQMAAPSLHSAAPGAGSGMLHRRDRYPIQTAPATARAQATTTTTRPSASATCRRARCTGTGPPPRRSGSLRHRALPPVLAFILCALRERPWRRPIKLRRRDPVAARLSAFTRALLH